MATIKFKNSPSIKKTVFFGYTSDNISNSDGTQTLVTNANANNNNNNNMTQIKFYDKEPDYAKDNVYLRSYELYIDNHPDSDDKTVSSIARTTTDKTKTYEDGYDLYIEEEPIAGNVFTSTGSLKVKVLTNNKVNIRVIYVGETNG